MKKFLIPGFGQRGFGSLGSRILQCHFCQHGQKAWIEVYLSQRGLIRLDLVPIEEDLISGDFLLASTPEQNAIRFEAFWHPNKDSLRMRIRMAEAGQ
jgi:hypothetical protein